MGDEHVPADVVPPTLSQPWGLTGPRIDGHPRNIAEPDGEARPVETPPSHYPYVVSPGSIYAATQRILANTQGQITAYQALKSHVENTKAWIFWASGPNVHNWEMPSLGGNAYGQTPAPVKRKTYQDPHPDQTAEIVAIQDNVLLAVADAITLAGQLVDMLNNAAQFYTKADKDSVPPGLNVTNSA